MGRGSGGPGPGAGPRALAQDMRLQARVDQTITAFRLRGHLRASAGSARPRAPAPGARGGHAHGGREALLLAELDQQVESGSVFVEPRVKLSELLGGCAARTRAHRHQFLQMLDSERLEAHESSR